MISKQLLYRISIVIVVFCIFYVAYSSYVVVTERTIEGKRLKVFNSYNLDEQTAKSAVTIINSVVDKKTYELGKQKLSKIASSNIVNTFFGTNKFDYVSISRGMTVDSISCDVTNSDFELFKLDCKTKVGTTTSNVVYLVKIKNGKVVGLDVLYAE